VAGWAAQEYIFAQKTAIGHLERCGCSVVRRLSSWGLRGVTAGVAGAEETGTSRRGEGAGRRQFSCAEMESHILDYVHGPCVHASHRCGENGARMGVETWGGVLGS